MKTTKILKWLVLPASTLLLIGCGGGGSSTASGPTTAQAFYVDSAVQGVDYSCGSQAGVTGEQGAFAFEVGKGCTFSLDKIKLRDVAAEQLENGKQIQETNIDIARVLLSLDSDHNPANGITIDSSFITKLMDYGMSTFEDIIDTWYPGFTVVSTAEAKAHLIQSILASHTLYTNISGELGTLESWTFNADISAISVFEIKGGNDKENMTITFDSSTFTLTSSEGDRIEIKNITEEYLLIAINGDETRLYYDEAKARAYFLK